MRAAPSGTSLPWWRTIRVMMTTRRPRRARATETGRPAGLARTSSALRSRRSGRTCCRDGRPSSRPASPRRRRSSDAWRPGCRGGCGRAGHGGRRRGFVMAARAPANAGDGARIVEIVGPLRQKRQQARCADMPKISNPTNHLRPTKVGAFILPSVGRVPLQPLSDPQTCAGTRHAPIEHDPGHGC